MSLSREQHLKLLDELGDLSVLSQGVRTKLHELERDLQEVETMHANLCLTVTKMKLALADAEPDADDGGFVPGQVLGGRPPTVDDTVQSSAQP